MKYQDKYIDNRKKRSINFFIVLIGVLAIMLTGFAYASKLKDIESYAFSSNTQNEIIQTDDSFCQS